MAAGEAGAAAWQADSPFLRLEGRRPRRARRPCPAARRGTRGAAAEGEGEEEGAAGAGAKLLLEAWRVCQPEGEGAGAEAEEQGRGPPPWQGGRPEEARGEEEGR